jgi:hypothetical protein
VLVEQTKLFVQVDFVHRLSSIEPFVLHRDHDCIGHVSPYRRLITASAMSIPAEIPDDVTNLPSSTQRA